MVLESAICEELLFHIFKGLKYKGPSIKDVSSEGEGGGYEKLQIGETFKA